MGDAKKLMEAVLRSIDSRQRSKYSVECGGQSVVLRDALGGVVAGISYHSIAHTIVVIGEAAVVGGTIDTAVRDGLTIINYHIERVEGYQSRFLGYVAGSNGIVPDLRMVNRTVGLQSPEKVSRS